MKIIDAVKNVREKDELAGHVFRKQYMRYISKPQKPCAQAKNGQLQTY